MAGVAGLAQARKGAVWLAWCVKAGLCEERHGTAGKVRRVAVLQGLAR